MRVLNILIFVLFVSAVPVVWDFPPLRNMTISPVIQRALEEGHALMGAGKLDDFLSTIPPTASGAQLSTGYEIERSTVLPPRFTLVPVYCLSYLCIGDLLGINNLTTSGSLPSSTESSNSTVISTIHIQPEAKSEIKSSYDCENLVHAAMVFFNSIPGVLFLAFMTLGKLVSYF